MGERFEIGSVKAGQEVVGRPGRVGSLTQVLVDSDSRRVTHFVLRRDGDPEREVIVPVEWVQGATRDRITLDVGEEQFGRLPEYRPDELIMADVLDVLWYRTELPTEQLHFVDVETRDGIVELSGYTGSEGSAAEIEAVARGVREVLGVRSSLTSFETLGRGATPPGPRPEPPSPDGGA